MDLEPIVLKIDKPLLGNNISRCNSYNQYELQLLKNVIGNKDDSTVNNICHTIKLYQIENGLTPSGILDDETRRKLYRHGQIVENGGLLNSARDLPQNFLDQVRLAAALCQYVYNCDEQRSKETMYSIYPWNVLMIDSLKDKSVTGDSLLQRIQMNGILGGIFSSKEKNMLNDIINRLNIIKDGDCKGYMSRNRTGFGMMLFYNSNENGITDIAFVTEGSNPFTQCNPFDEAPINSKCTKPERWINGIGDWILSNGAQGLLNLSPQHTLSIQIARVIDKYCRSQKPEIDLHFYGHSLGGGLAAACALATNREAITFDMAGLHTLRRLFYGYEQKLNNIKNFFVTGEALSTPIWTKIGLEHNGIQFEIPNENSLDSISAHSMTVICNFLGCKPEYSYEYIC